jgi:hypothetical protein
VQFGEWLGLTNFELTARAGSRAERDLSPLKASVRYLRRRKSEGRRDAAAYEAARRRVGTVPEPAACGRAAPRNMTQFHVFLRPSAALGSLGAGFAFPGCSVVPSVRRVPNPSAQ